MTEEKSGITYADAGVDYDAMDPFKVECLELARLTSRNIRSAGCKLLEWSRGESCTVTEINPGEYVACVLEGLGTKAVIAKEMKGLAAAVGEATGRSFFANVAQCNVAMAVNDLSTSGARAIGYHQYAAVGSSNWFNDIEQRRGISEGTFRAVNLSEAAWGGGETPTNKDVIAADEIDLAGAMWGLIRHGREPINPANVREGDAIVIVESSGIHANGLTLARKIAGELTHGYLHELSDGRTYGETLLDPTHIYARFVEDCLAEKVDIHYLVNVTGHGWRKFMRAPQPWTYVLEKLPEEQTIFSFIKDLADIDDREMYGTFNMGAGFAFYVPESDVDKVIQCASDCGFRAFRAGHVEAGPKQVVIKPKNITFTARDLQLR